MSGSADPQVVKSNQELILNSGEVCEEQTESLAYCVTEEEALCPDF